MTPVDPSSPVNYQRVLTFYRATGDITPYSQMGALTHSIAPVILYRLQSLLEIGISPFGGVSPIYWVKTETYPRLKPKTNAPPPPHTPQCTPTHTHIHTHIQNQTCAFKFFFCENSTLINGTKT